MNRVILTSLLLFPLVAGTVHAAPIAQVEGGRTSVVLAPEFLGALEALQVKTRAIAPGQLNAVRGVVNFPIPTGVVDLGSLKGDIFHSGGLGLRAGSTRVALYNFIISTTGNSPVLTGLAAVNGDIVDRIPLFDLELTTDPEVSDEGVVTLRRVNVTLHPTAAETLNAVFGVDAFFPGLTVGRALLVTNVYPAP